MKKEREPYRLVIEVPECPENLNRAMRMNWKERMRRKRYWHDVIWKLCLGKCPAGPLEKFKIRITRYGARMLDFDGLVGSMKPLVDGLIHARVIKDDGWIRTGVWDVGQEFRPKKDGEAVVLEVEEAG